LSVQRNVFIDSKFAILFFKNLAFPVIIFLNFPYASKKYIWQKEIRNDYYSISKYIADKIMMWLNLLFIKRQIKFSIFQCGTWEERGQNILRIYVNIIGETRWFEISNDYYAQHKSIQRTTTKEMQLYTAYFTVRICLVRNKRSQSIEQATKVVDASMTTARARLN